MKKCLVIFIFLFAVKSFAQQNPDIKRTWHWYFGNGAGLDFSSGTAVADTNGQIHSFESCAVMSDTAGKLLFYTDGDTVWDRRHMMMPNGYGLKSCGNYYGSTAKGTLIVPQPGQDSIYYIFTVDCWENLVIDGVRYSIVNLNKNSGYGDVVSKNILLFKPSTESIVATQSSTKDTIWIVTHEYNTNVYRIYKIDKNGLDTIPIFNKIGNIHSDYVTYMCFSPNGKKLAAFNYGGTSELFDFANGYLTNFISLPDGGYGACFSNDNSKLYFTRDGNTIIQFSLCSDNIPSTLTIFYDTTAPDNSTYGSILNTMDTSLLMVSSIGKDSISTIHICNSKLVSNNVHRFSISLKGKYSGLGLPNFISTYFNQIINSNICDKDSAIDVTDVHFNIIFIPNVFTPNNDGVNDNFSIEIAGYKNIEFFIYNRWGNLLIHGNKDLNPQIKSEEKLWNGKIQKDDAPTGIYYYLINITNTKNETEIKKGFFQLLK
ncbi:MAG: hypothetical protein Fur0023_10990 [Bacteroidia bacterium]